MRSTQKNNNKKITSWKETKAVQARETSDSIKQGSSLNHSHNPINTEH